MCRSGLVLSAYKSECLGVFMISWCMGVIDCANWCVLSEYMQGKYEEYVIDDVYVNKCKCE